MNSQEKEIVISSKTRQLIEQIKKREGLPALNDNIQDIFRLTDDSEASASDLAAVIMRDCGLAANLLVAANSPTLAARAPVKTITSAITFLGFDQIYLMALAFSVFKQNMHDNFDLELLKLYTSSYFSGVISMELAHECKYEYPEELFVAGLFYNLPNMVLAYAFPEEYRRMDIQLQRGVSIESACLQVFGVSYEEICVGIAEVYHIPGKVEDMLRKRESKDSARDIIDEATNLTGMLFGRKKGGKAELKKAEERMRKLTGKAASSVTDLIRESCGRDKNMTRFFNLNPDDIDMMVSVLEWGKAIPAQVVNKLGIGEGLDDNLRLEDKFDSTFNYYMQELFVLRRSKPDLNRVLMLAQEAIYHSLRCPDVFTTFVDQNFKQLKGRLFVGEESTISANDLQIPMEYKNSPVIKCFIQKTPCIWSRKDGDWQIPGELEKRMNLEHAIFAPLVVNDRAIGLYIVGRKEDIPFAAKEELWLAQIIEQVEMVCERLRTKTF
jgi:HD-like signal output (HDOD) protein